jgi:hypothetical protein
MRLSLTLILSFFFFKSVTGLTRLGGYVWYNDKAGPNDCDLSDAAFVDGAVDDVLEQAGIAEASSWAIGSYSYQGIRGGDRELCTQWCINRCKNTIYLCYGTCEGCAGGRRAATMAWNPTIDDGEKPDYQELCESAVQGEASNDEISDTCREALKEAKCDVHYTMRDGP